jgi:hypothetical protein
MTWEKRAVATRVKLYGEHQLSTRIEDGKFSSTLGIANLHSKFYRDSMTSCNNLYSEYRLSVMNNRGNFDSPVLFTADSFDFPKFQQTKFPPEF